MVHPWLCTQTGSICLLHLCFSRFCCSGGKRKRRETAWKLPQWKIVCMMLGPLSSLFACFLAEMEPLNLLSNHVSNNAGYILTNLWVLSCFIWVTFTEQMLLFCLSWVALYRVWKVWKCVFSSHLLDSLHHILTAKLYSLVYITSQLKPYQWVKWGNFIHLDLFMQDILVSQLFLYIHGQSRLPTGRNSWANLGELIGCCWRG